MSSLRAGKLLSLGSTVSDFLLEKKIKDDDMLPIWIDQES